MARDKHSAPIASPPDAADHSQGARDGDAAGQGWFRRPSTRAGRTKNADRGQWGRTRTDYGQPVNQALRNAKMSKTSTVPEPLKSAGQQGFMGPLRPGGEQALLSPR